jgi:NADPH:quinone reductase
MLAMRKVVVTELGGPDALTVIDSPMPVPGPNEALVKIVASGVNFIDTYFRTGLYKAPEMPISIGSEGAGVVEGVGADVRDLKAGDRVAYAMARGSYAEYAVVPAAMLVKVPDGVDTEVAAAIMLQGMTSHYLTHSTFPLDKTHTCLVHAAAGGTGGILVQVAKARGARVIGTTSTPDKAKAARDLGADEVILYTEQDFVAETKRLTGGRGVDVVYDSVGQTTFLKSLSCLRPRGMMVLFGQSSGPVTPFDPASLNGLGSLFLTRPNLGHHVATREELLWRATDILSLVSSGALKVRISGRYPLADAAQAHRDLEARKTFGKFLITNG